MQPSTPPWPPPPLPSPSFNNPSLKYLRVLYSSSVPSDCAVELNCTVWYVQVFSKNVHHNDKYLHLSCHSCSRRPVYCLQTELTIRNDCYTKGQRQFGFSSSFQSCLLASSPFIVPQLCTFWLESSYEHFIASLLFSDHLCIFFFLPVLGHRPYVWQPWTSYLSFEFTLSC